MGIELAIELVSMLLCQLPEPMRKTQLLASEARTILPLVMATFSQCLLAEDEKDR
ncbi:MAG TPA: hypothetical protein VF493_23055 [Terriglobales bacterium]